MTEDFEKYKKRTIDAANMLHYALIQLQNSGEVEEHAASELVAWADKLREDIHTFFELYEVN